MISEQPSYFMIIYSTRYRSVRPPCVWPRVTSPVSVRGPGGRTPTCAASVAWSTTRAALRVISPIWRRPRRSRGRPVTTLRATVTCFTSVVRYFFLYFFYETYESIITCIIYHIKKLRESVLKNSLCLVPVCYWVVWVILWIWARFN